MQKAELGSVDIEADGGSGAIPCWSARPPSSGPRSWSPASAPTWRPCRVRRNQGRWPGGGSSPRPGTAAARTRRTRRRRCRAMPHLRGAGQGLPADLHRLSGRLRLRLDQLVPAPLRRPQSSAPQGLCLKTLGALLKCPSARPASGASLALVRRPAAQPRGPGGRGGAGPGAQHDPRAARPAARRGDRPGRLARILDRPREAQSTNGRFRPSIGCDVP